MHKLSGQLIYLGLCFINTEDKPTLVFEQQDRQRNVINETDYQHLLNQAEL